MVKYNSTGGVLWKTTWGSAEPDLGNGVAVDGGSGLVYVVGTTRGLMTSSGEAADEAGGGVEAGSASVAAGEDITVAVNAGMSDVFLTCLGAADGEVQWTRQFGSSAVDVGNSVAVGPRGGVFVVGQLGDDGDESLAGPRAFLAKYDYLGNAQVCLVVGWPRAVKVLVIALMWKWFCLGIVDVLLLLLFGYQHLHVVGRCACCLQVCVPDRGHAACVDFIVDEGGAC